MVNERFGVPYMTGELYDSRSVEELKAESEALQVRAENEAKKLSIEQSQLQTEIIDKYISDVNVNKFSQNVKIHKNNVIVPLEEWNDICSRANARDGIMKMSDSIIELAQKVQGGLMGPEKDTLRSDITRLKSELLSLQQELNAEKAKSLESKMVIDSIKELAPELLCKIMSKMEQLRKLEEEQDKVMTQNNRFI